MKSLAKFLTIAMSLLLINGSLMAQTPFDECYQQANHKDAHNAAIAVIACRNASDGFSRCFNESFDNCGIDRKHSIMLCQDAPTYFASCFETARSIKGVSCSGAVNACTRVK